MDMSEVLEVIKQCQAPARGPCSGDCPVNRHILLGLDDTLRVTMGICDLLIAVQEELKHDREVSGERS